MNEQMKINQ